MLPVDGRCSLTPMTSRKIVGKSQGRAEKGIRCDVLVDSRCVLVKRSNEMFRLCNATALRARHRIGTEKTYKLDPKASQIFFLLLLECLLTERIAGEISLRGMIAARAVPEGVVFGVRRVVFIVRRQVLSVTSPLASGFLNTDPSLALSSLHSFQTPSFFIKHPEHHGIAKNIDKRCWEWMRCKPQYRVGLIELEDH
ncbi:hypothetical protein PM082_021314 [Marasmius tenuissimus]|nr:hypothetical protein PM082_021314 [Marasmius tenuissimus]